MSKTILAHINGFTPAVDHIVAEHGIITAVVFGVIWRNCQLSDGVCAASIDMLSKQTGIRPRAIIAHAKKLIENGYLTYDGHTFCDTGLTTITISMKAS